MSDASLLANSEPQIRRSAPEMLLYSTIRIECEYATGGKGTGTGFFFAFARQDKLWVPTIVTNKHVVADATRGTFFIHRRESSGLPSIHQSEQFTFDQFHSRWTPHPDASVDLCVMPIANVLDESDKTGKPLGFIPLELSLIPTDKQLSELTPLEEVLMIGYPNGIWDSQNNMPILRRGVTATHPAIDYEGRKEFMIDAACFPGSSGSPVFLYSTGGYYMPNGNFMIGGVRLMLLGVLYAGPQHKVTGELQIVNVPTSQQVVAFSKIPNNLGLVIKANRLHDFEQLIQQEIAKSV